MKNNSEQSLFISKDGGAWDDEDRTVATALRQMSVEFATQQSVANSGSDVYTDARAAYFMGIM